MTYVPVIKHARHCATTGVGAWFMAEPGFIINCQSTENLFSRVCSRCLHFSDHASYLAASKTVELDVETNDNIDNGKMWTSRDISDSTTGSSAREAGGKLWELSRSFPRSTSLGEC